MNENNGLHVILDIDGTLIDNTRINNNILSNNHDGISCGHFIYFRPYLIQISRLLHHHLYLAWALSD